MSAEEAEESTAAVVLHFPTPPWRTRLADYVRSRTRPRAILVFAGLALVPYLVVRAAMVGNLGGLGTFLLALGVGTSLAVFWIGALTVIVERMETRTLTFTESGIQQETRRAIRQHGWDWVVAFFEDDSAITIAVQRPKMRSFRLERREPELLVVRKEQVGPEAMARLRALLSSNVPTSAKPLA